MDTLTFKMLKALSYCTLRPASWEKRFVKDLGALGTYDLLSLRQQGVIEILYWRYQGQIMALQARYPAAGYPTPQKTDRMFVNEHHETRDDLHDVTISGRDGLRISRRTMNCAIFNIKGE